jgi:hypothetical protein
MYFIGFEAIEKEMLLGNATSYLLKVDIKFYKIFTGRKLTVKYILYFS